MNYFLCKLRFITPLHIGDSESARSLDSSNMTICADTLFSALCHTALLTDGKAGIDKLVEYTLEDRLRFSDLHPYSGSRLFLPKPFMLHADTRKIIKASRTEKK